MGAMQGAEGKTFSHVVVTKGHPVVIQLEAAQIHGMVHLRRDQRVKDAFNRAEPFIAVTQVKVYDAEGKNLLRETEFMALNRNKVVWALEAEPSSGK